MKIGNPVIPSNAILLARRILRKSIHLQVTSYIKMHMVNALYDINVNHTSLIKNLVRCYEDRETIVYTK